MKFPGPSAESTGSRHTPRHSDLTLLRTRQAFVLTSHSDVFF
jgi:hypothetical protein